MFGRSRTNKAMRWNEAKFRLCFYLDPRKEYQEEYRNYCRYLPVMQNNPKVKKLDHQSKLWVEIFLAVLLEIIFMHVCMSTYIYIYIYIYIYLSIYLSIYIYIWTRNQCVYVLHNKSKTKNTTFVWRIFVFF